jgi:hypothetical protein
MAHRPATAGRKSDSDASAAIRSLGGACALFGAYLGSRVDLLSPELRSDLARVEVLGRPMSWPTLRAVIAEELGIELERAYAVMEVSPARLGDFTETHRASLHDGTPVLVTIVNRQAVAGIDRELDRLPSVGPALNGVVPRATLAYAIRDFIDGWPRLHDLSVLGGAHQRWTRRPIDDFAAPRLYERLSTSTILTIGREESRPLGTDYGLLPVDLACRVCTVWLRLALDGLPFPIDPDYERIHLTSEGRVIFDSTAVATLTDAERADLWQYLVAVTAGDLEAAAGKLLAHTHGDVDPGLAREFRQIVTFRDGPWGEAGSSIAESLFVQWRIATSAGRPPAGRFPAVYRGLHALCAAMRHVDPGGDSLAVAIRTTRIVMALDQVRALATGNGVEDLLDRYARAALELPHQVDDAFPIAPGDRVDSVREGVSEARANVTIVAIAAGALFVSLTVALPRAALMFGDSDYARPIWAAGLVVAGLLLLLSTRRPRCAPKGADFHA